MANKSINCENCGLALFEGDTALRVGLNGGIFCSSECVETYFFIESASIVLTREDVGEEME